jgi:hypothetical protein
VDEKASDMEDMAEDNTGNRACIVDLVVLGCTAGSHKVDGRPALEVLNDVVVASDCTRTWMG